MDKLIIKGARSHNLKNIDLEIPKNKLVVITGLSGSGKSSLAFDTIYAEGQRRYVESLSAYARQFLGTMQKADVDSIEGLSPAISIDQKTSGHNPRSTVGTVSEIYDYLRLLFARAGHPHSPKSGRRLQSQSAQQIVDTVLAFPAKNKVDNVKILVLAPLIKKRKGTYEELFQRLLSQGYVRARVDGQIFSLEEDIKLDRYVIHNIDVVIDRLVVKADSHSDKDFVKRLTDSIEAALNLGEKEIYINNVDLDQDTFYSEKLVDPETGESFPQVEPHTFSFNSPFGACTRCNGLGNIFEIDKNAIYNPNLSISEGGIFPWSRMADNANSWHMQMLTAISEVEGFSLREPMSKLKPEHLQLVLYGAGEKRYAMKYFSEQHKSVNSITTKHEGVIPNLLRRYKETESDFIRHEIEEYMREIVCPECNGDRLKPEALAVTIAQQNIKQVSAMPLHKLKNWVDGLKTPDAEIATIENDKITAQERTIVKQVIKEIESRIDFLLAVGLDYLSLNRTARTLSGGESQRIRLASQIGTGLSGVLYVLDEPSIGLHQKDNEKLLATLHKLRDLGNSILVVEHDQDTIESADYLIDMGPGAGEHGGQVIAQGTPEEVKNNPDSVTGRFLSGKDTIEKSQIKSEAQIFANKIPAASYLSPVSGKNLVLHGAKANNLKNLTVEFPLGKFISITGVSGSGKSSLINETLAKALRTHFYGSKDVPGSYDRIDGLDNIDKVIVIDQSPIGRTPRSNPATYTGIFTPIREMFAATPESRTRGYKIGRFSFNVRGGRCETCQGDGVIKIEMQFLPDVYVTCEECQGKRYNRETLQIDFKGKNISQVLDMSVEEAYEYFENVPAIRYKLETLKLVGLDYIRLGQQATTLSGGEAQRIKLAAELSKRSTGRTLYILDEPTTGLHFADLKKLLLVLHSLVARGNTVIVIEHNLDLIKTSDWIIDLGPEGGDRGGKIIAEGTPEDIAANKKSYTGEWLKKYI
jgi:excinuclease ABC subunit A